MLGGSTSAALQGTSEADFKRVIFLSQLSQVLCIKSYLEELRRGEHTMGALIWQLVRFESLFQSKQAPDSLKFEVQLT